MLRPMKLAARLYLLLRHPRRRSARTALRRRAPGAGLDQVEGNCPASLDWADLSGKAVVISFKEGDDVLPDDIVDWNEIASNLQADPVLFSFK
jgi:hypothetical protein